MPDPNEGTRYITPRDDRRAPRGARFVIMKGESRLAYAGDERIRDRMLKAFGEGCTWVEVGRLH